MITTDLDRVLAAAGLPRGAWRPAPGVHPRLGTYATAVAFGLAARDGAARDGAPGAVAARLAGGLRALDWVGGVTVSGGYLTVTVTAEALAGLAVRITSAGPDCARSGGLAGTAVAAPASAGLASAPDWAGARDRLAAHLTGRLAKAAGASVAWIEYPERQGAGRSADGAAGDGAGGEAGRGEAGGGESGAGGPAAAAVAFAGWDLVVLALAGLAPGASPGLDPVAVAAHHLRNPAYAVLYAHAHAASVLRHAADLGLEWADAAGCRPCLLAHPREWALLDRLSWLPEEVAAAARRGRPDVLVRYLEGLARVYLDCHECCPAVWPGMAAEGPGPAAGPHLRTARLWLAAAARSGLAAGLGLLGVAAPDRL